MLANGPDLQRPGHDLIHAVLSPVETIDWVDDATNPAWPHPRAVRSESYILPRGTAGVGPGHGQGTELEHTVAPD